MSHRFLFSRMSDIKSNWLSRYLANPIVKEYQCQLGDQSLCYSETMTEIKEFLVNPIRFQNKVQRISKRYKIASGAYSVRPQVGNYFIFLTINILP